jgi:hypothetical protein
MNLPDDQAGWLPSVNPAPRGLTAIARYGQDPAQLRAVRVDDGWRLGGSAQGVEPPSVFRWERVGICAEGVEHPVVAARP